MNDLKAVVTQYPCGPPKEPEESHPAFPASPCYRPLRDGELIPENAEFKTIEGEWVSIRNGRENHFSHKRYNEKILQPFRIPVDNSQESASELREDC